MEQRIIGGKGTRAADLSRIVKPGPREAAPSVRNVRIDAGSAGQRLDNFLAKILKGVPRTHLYRVIRSGEMVLPRNADWWATYEQRRSTWLPQDVPAPLPAVEGRGR